MKQHITTKQLEELSDKNQKRIKNWQIEKGHYFLTGDAIRIKTPIYFTIGQMIEFLEEHDVFLYSILVEEPSFQRHKNF